MSLKCSAWKDFRFLPKKSLKKNTSLAAPGALANRLQRRTARKANKANLDPQIKNPRSLLYSNMAPPVNFRKISFLIRALLLWEKVETEKKKSGMEKIIVKIAVH